MKYLKNFSLTACFFTLMLFSVVFTCRAETKENCPKIDGLIKEEVLIFKSSELLDDENGGETLYLEALSPSGETYFLDASDVVNVEDLLADKKGKKIKVKYSLVQDWYQEDGICARSMKLTHVSPMN